VHVIKSSLILVLLLGCSASALAQTATPSSVPRYREWEGSGFAGYAFPQDFRFRTIVSGNDQQSTGIVGMHFESGYRVGGQVTQYLGNFLSAQLEYSFSDQPLHLTNLKPEIPHLYLGHNLHSLTYSVSYLPRPPEKRLRPFVSAGTGPLLFHITRDSKQEVEKLNLDLRDSWELVLNLGGGIKYLVADQFAFTVDVKSRLSRLPTYGLPRSSQLVDGQYQPGLSVRGLLNSWQINFGLAHQWDEW
jgi:opacity protein-like surface antigen